jgi:rhamnulokinase
MNYFLAIDIGASSGRHILGHYENGELKIEEIYRFKTILHNGGSGKTFWDVRQLFSDILWGLKEAKKLNKIPSRISIDTFGVDYALLDSNDHLIGEVESYRDERTEEAKKAFLSPEVLYKETGIQPQVFNSVYQLFIDKQTGKLAKAKSIMLLPSFLCYLLTGEKQNEKSILSTTGLFCAENEDYSPMILKALGLNRDVFNKTIEAGSFIGPLRQEIAKDIGYTSNVYATLEHDTAAAFAGSGSRANQVLLSSGTWSLLGALLPKPIINDKAYKAGFTNELSHNHEVRFLKNIMGMWIVNRVREEATTKIDIVSVVNMAREGSSYLYTFDTTSEELLNPTNMKKAIIGLLTKSCYPLPANDAELYYCIYHSLAVAYGKAIKELESLTNMTFDSIVIFGGGSKNKLLNELTAKVSHLPVVAGPSEATAIGNILSVSKDIKE